MSYHILPLPLVLELALSVSISTFWIFEDNIPSRLDVYSLHRLDEILRLPAVGSNILYR